MLSTLPQAHATFLNRIRDAVASDVRFRALLIGGSYVHGGLDEHSDLDFDIVVEDNCYADVLSTRKDFAEALPGFLNAFTGEHVGEPRLLICLYGPPLLHIDLKFSLASDLDQQIERRAVLFARDPAEIEKRIEAAAVAWPNRPSEWFEARAWIWLHYAATKLARGELYEAIGMLGFFREQVLGPLLYRRAGKDQRGVRRLETLRLDEERRLATTIALHDALSVRDAIKASASIYLDLRADDPSLEPTTHMPGLLYDLIERAVPCAAAAVPESMAAHVMGYKWARDKVGQSGCAVYRLHSKSGGSDLFLKHGKDAFADDVTDEMVRLRWLAGHISVPSVVSFVRTPNQAWLLTTAIHGKTAYQVLKSDFGARLVVVDALAAFMRRLHAIPVSECSFNSDHACRLARARERIEAGVVDVDDFDKEREGWTAEQVWEAMHRLLPLAPDPVVTHGDFSLDNLLIVEGKVVGCIDVGRAGIADRYQDLAVLWNCLEEFEPSLQERLVAQYGIADPDRRKLQFHLLLDELF